MRGLQSRLDNVVKPGRWAMRYRFGLIVVATVVVSVGMGGVMARAAVRPAVVADPASAVDMRVMTTGGGNDFPGADVPFGMVQWSPDTSPSRPLGGGYHFHATQFRGLSLTHMAGPRRGAMQDVPILPMTGAHPANPDTRTEPFTHTREIAQA